MNKIVQKGNKQLQIPEERLQDMLNQGYVEVDAKGKPVAKPAKVDPKALKAENEALKKVNEELTAANKEMNAKIEDLTKQLEEKAAEGKQ